MTKAIQGAGYMVQDIQGEAIYGVGATVDEAWAQAYAEATQGGPFVDINGDEMTADAVFEKHFKVYGATQALIDHVNKDGGGISWQVVRGVACTDAEADSE